MFECEYFTDALGTKFPKRVKPNEIRILVDKSSRSVDFCYPSSFTSEERNSRLADLKVISTEIEKSFDSIQSQVMGKSISLALIEKVSDFLEEILSRRVPSVLVNHDYKVTYWVQE